MKVSVVIPARNSERTIARTLDAVFSGTRMPDQVIVVDGMSCDRTREMALEYPVEVIANRELHTVAARGLGLANSRYGIVAFTDADCLPRRDWLEKAHAHLTRDRNLDGVGGPVTVTAPVNNIQSFSATVFEQIMQFPDEPTLLRRKSMKGCFPEANCAYRRSTLIREGYSDWFTNHAEGIDLLWRLVDCEAKLLFDPAMIVEHLGYPSELRELIVKNFNYGIASTKLAKAHMKNCRVDLSIYRNLVSSAITTLNPLDKDSLALLRVTQLASFLAGKYYASTRYRVINI